MQIELNLKNVVTAKVIEATSPGAFLPFTTLPDHYKGKTVALVIVTDAMLSKDAEENKSPEQIPLI